GGSSKKLGVWLSDEGWRFNQKYRSAEDALEKIKTGLSKLIKATEEGRFDDLDRTGIEEMGTSRYSLRCKPLYLYFPDEFLPIYSKDNFALFYKVFGLEPPRGGDIFTLNRYLLTY